MPEAKELRFLICKGCSGQIDDIGCLAGCKYDVMSFSDRDPKTLECHIYVYVFNRVEPYKKGRKKSKKQTI